MTAAVGEAPDPPHPASAAANIKIAAKQHHATNRFWREPARSTKGSMGLEFKYPYFLSAGTLNTNISDSELLLQDVRKQRRGLKSAPLFFLADLSARVADFPCDPRRPCSP